MRPAALLLAGGAGSRMGASVPKPLLPLGGRPLAAHILKRLTPFCAPVLIGTAEPTAYAGFGLPCIPDIRQGRAGPLAGLEAASVFLETLHVPPSRLLCVPGDTPFLPRDLVARLCEGAGDQVRIARCRDRTHPTVALWPVEHLRAIAPYLDDPSSNGSILGLLRRLGHEEVDFPADPSSPDADPFFNLNTPADFEKAASVGE